MKPIYTIWLVLGILVLPAGGQVVNGVVPLHLLREPTAQAQEGVYFDDSAPDQLRVGNAYYEVSLSKNNGAILAIIDKQANNTALTRGSRGGCLWGGSFPTVTPNYVGGCSYSASDPNRFSYVWNPANSTLTLSYTGNRDAPRWVDATVILTTSPAPYFDLQLLNVSNHWGDTLRQVLIPSDLLFTSTAVQAGYGPFHLPGVRLKPAFFTSFLPNRANCPGREHCEYTPVYPGAEAFADYLALDVAGGHLAFYSINPPASVQPASLGFVDDTPGQANTFYTRHAFLPWVADGSTYTAPPMRVRVGQSAQDTMLAYRADNGIAEYPSVAVKLGDRFEQVTHAPLIKADIAQINKPFRNWNSDLDDLPRPSLLHPVAYEPRGFDENYPDFLPPDPRWGSTADFREMVRAAHDRSLLVMPYINPTWWDDESPTLHNLAPPLTIASVAVRDENGMSHYETYGSRGGYAVSPFAPFVQQRLATLLQQWRTEVPVDFVFEDQIGARPWLLDLNPAAPNPTAYSNGWLAHVDTYAGQGLMTEDGWDRLARQEIGFDGTVLTSQHPINYADQRWGAGNWEPYPLAVWLLHDKVLIYQHDLDRNTMSQSKEVLTWNLAFGVMLSYDWGGTNNGQLDRPWLDLISALQQKVAARYAGQPLAEYSQVTPTVTRSRFADLMVLANWDPVSAYGVAGSQIAPGGFRATTADGSVLAGIFSGQFNSRPLTPGDHYLLVERGPQSTVVRQPIGADTDLVIDALPGSGSGIRVWVRDRRDQRLGEVAATADGGRVRFHYSASYNGQPVGSYEIPGPACRTFPETHQAVCGQFLAYWESHGGLAQQGYPLTGEFTETSDLDRKPYSVQYFERAVFERHPENQPPYDVLLAQLGTYQYRQKYPAGAPGQHANTDNPRYFAETGHTVGGAFRSYWEAHGGLAQQGFPISDEFTEVSDLDPGKSYTVQYFERAVFEYHPANQAPFNVLLSQLGTIRLHARYPGGPPPPE